MENRRLESECETHREDVRKEIKGGEIKRQNLRLQARTIQQSEIYIFKEFKVLNSHSVKLSGCKTSDCDLPISLSVPKDVSCC